MGCKAPLSSSRLFSFFLQLDTFFNKGHTESMKITRIYWLGERPRNNRRSA